MGARVEFLEAPPGAAGGAAAAAPRPRVSVPAEAVRTDGGATVVWLVRDGRLERREVDAGPVSGGMREIRSGLVGGEVMLLSGVDAPAAGVRVRVEGQPGAGSR
jgi:hypothetical protein